MALNWSLQHKRDTAANWTANNPTLLAGQLGIETDNLTTTPKFKVGDGTTAWNSLPYFYGGSLSAQDIANVLSVGNDTGGLSLKMNTGTTYYGATNQTHVTYNAGIELHNTTANKLVNLSDAGLWKVDAVQYMPNLTASRLLSLDSNKYVVTSYTTTGSGTEIALSTSPVFSSGITIDGITVGLGAGSVTNNTVIGAGAFVANTTGARNTIIGASAAVTQSTANEVVAIGRQAANFNTAHQTTAVGTYALYNNTTGTENTALGFQAGNNNQTGNNNVFIGWGAGYSVTGSNCTIIGFNAGRNTTGANNTFIGRQAGLTNTTGTDNIFIGFQSGYYETGSNKLFIDNIQRASEADARTKSLIYGVFAATTAAQTLSLNAVVTISENLVTPIHYGATTASGTLTLYSTSNATKGKILFGTSGYDEVNNRLGVGNSIPAHPLDVTGKINASGEISGSFFSLSGATLIDNSAGIVRIAVSGGFTGIGLLKDITVTDAKNFIFNTTTGTKIGTATTQKLSFWNATPIVQPTTAYSAASFTANAGTAVNDASTFDGYTLKQIVAALRGIGLLA